MLVVLAGTMPSAGLFEAGPARGKAAVAVADAAADTAAVRTDPCADEGCADCGPACSACGCHAPLAMVATPVPMAGPSVMRLDASFPLSLGAPAGMRQGIERPPRA